MIIMFLITIITILIVVCVVTSNRKKKKVENPKLKFGDSYGVPPQKTDDPHLTVPIYSYVRSSPVWICKNCECENNNMASACCVCGKPR